MADVVAVLCSDIHRSHTPPVFRAAEPDWYAAMDRPLLQVVDEANRYHVPLVIAGDIFDRWQMPPETVNATIKVLKRLESGCYAVPGQHDLPNHSYDDIHRSAYWTLVEADVLKNLEPGQVESVHVHELNGYLQLYGFPWGHPLTPREGAVDPSDVHLAVVHAYVWMSTSTSYPGAPDEGKLSGFKKSLTGYDAAVFGDNHIGFHTRVDGTDVLNCGGFQIRKSDEVAYRPQYGLLYSDGTIQTRPLDVSEDVYSEVDKETASRINPMVSRALAREIDALGADSLDFRDALDRFMDLSGTEKAVRSLVYDSIG
jgi:DNA repair exonuclease SbcCD nuclease subunit